MKLAVVLFNLGGPDTLAAVRPFLINLFSDPRIIGAPGPLRWLLARLIAGRRAPMAREIYRQIGGGSPLLANTERQAAALGERLRTIASDDVRVYIAMRYWHPTSDATVAAVEAFAPDRIVLLPLYPQFSTTTTGSSIAAWRRSAARAGLDRPTTAVCCYPVAAGFIAALAARIAPVLAASAGAGTPRILFSAHGLPRKIVARGDPYQWQVEQTAAATVAALAPAAFDWVVCYQSRVGPLEWIGPSTDDEIRRAGRDGVAVVVVPLAFVSEHSETLVELDIEYRELAMQCGVPDYRRVATVDDGATFIGALADAVMASCAGGSAVAGLDGARLCPVGSSQCPYGEGAPAP